MLVMKKENPVGQFRETWFPNHEDATWKAWVDIESRRYRDLSVLVANGEIRETFKARALIILLAPDVTNVPVYWKQERDSVRSMLEVRAIELGGLSASLLRFVTELLIHACETLRQQRSDDSRNRALDACNAYIMQLLKLLPIEEGARIWPYFLINDPAAYWNMEDASGYEPWKSLMYDREIPMHWKRLADAQFREIIDQELAGERKAREDWETALFSYTSHVGVLVFRAREDHQLCYDIDLLSDQLKYLLSKRKWQVIQRHCMETAMHLLGEEKYRSLRQELVRGVVSYSDDPFRIYADDDLRTAELMLAAFNQADDPVAVKLRRLIERGRPIFEQKQREARLQREHRQALLDQMKS